MYGTATWRQTEQATCSPPASTLPVSANLTTGSASMAALGMAVLVLPVSKMSEPLPCPAGDSTALICRSATVSRNGVAVHDVKHEHPSARTREVRCGCAYLALDRVQHGRVHLLAHEAASQQAPDDVELKKKKKQRKPDSVSQATANE
jgi:hypothetical protein